MGRNNLLRLFKRVPFETQASRNTRQIASGKALVDEDNAAPEVPDDLLITATQLHLEIKKLVEQGKIEEAKTLLTQSLESHPHSKRLKTWSTKLL